MKQRTTLHIFLSILTSLLLIVFSVTFQSGGDVGDWIRAHRTTPLLWLIDFSAFYLLILMGMLSNMRGRAVRQAREVTALKEEHRKQLEAVVTQIARMDETNALQEEKIVALETERDERQESFEVEARRLTEQAFRSLQGQIEAHTRQLEAVNMALQYHRAELSQLRHNLKELQPGADTVHIARLSPAELQAFQEEPPLPIFDTPVQETEEILEAQHQLVALVEKPLLSLERIQTHEEDAFTPALSEPTHNAHSTVVLETADFEVIPSPEFALAVDDVEETGSLRDIARARRISSARAR